MVPKSISHNSADAGLTASVGYDSLGGCPIFRSSCVYHLAISVDNEWWRSEARQIRPCNCYRDLHGPRTSPREASHAIEMPHGLLTAHAKTPWRCPYIPFVHPSHGRSPCCSGPRMILHVPFKPTPASALSSCRLKRCEDGRGRRRSGEVVLAGSVRRRRPIDAPWYEWWRASLGLSCRLELRGTIAVPAQAAPCKKPPQSSPTAVAIELILHERGRLVPQATILMGRNRTTCAERLHVRYRTSGWDSITAPPAGRHQLR